MVGIVQLILSVWLAIPGDPQVQVVYAHLAEHPSRYDEMAGQFRQIAHKMGNLVDESAHKTGGHRHIRFVLDDNGQIAIEHVVLSQARGIPWQMRQRGHYASDRKYIIFVDVDDYCGYSLFPGLDVAGYAYVGRPCWEERTALHELLHILGAVSPGAPHSDGGTHCTDGFDIMCNLVGQPLCPLAHWQLLDCNNDDYFHTNSPPGSFLAENPGANVANSPYLTDEEMQFHLPLVFSL